MRSSGLRSSRCQRCCIAPLDQPRIVHGDIGVYRYLTGVLFVRRAGVHRSVAARQMQSLTQKLISICTGLVIQSMVGVIKLYLLRSETMAI
jgi:hypothetical protein